MKLEIRNLSFSYDGRRKVLDGMSLSADEGQFICLLGRNGAGKTTLFRTLLGTLRKKEGEILTDGDDLSKLSARERAGRIAYIPQESSQSFSYTVLNAVLMGTTNRISTLASPGEKEVNTAIEALRRFGIEALKDRKTDSLSGGERQLVLCARAVSQNARILLFDEPTSSLDWANQIRTLSLIRSLTREGYLAIVSTHNVQDALNYADRIVLLDRGRIVSDSTPAELAENSALADFYSLPLTIKRVDDTYVCIPEL